MVSQDKTQASIFDCDGQQVHRDTLNGLADVDAGRIIDGDKVLAWIESRGSESELPLSSVCQVFIAVRPYQLSPVFFACLACRLAICLALCFLLGCYGRVWGFSSGWHHIRRIFQNNRLRNA